MKITPVNTPSIGAIGTDSGVPQTARDRALNAFKDISVTPVYQQGQEVPREIPTLSMSTQEARVPTFDPNQNQTDAAIEDTKPLSPQMLAIAKQKRALQARESELAKRESALGDNGDRIDLAQIKQDPLSVLRKAGVTYEELTQAVINNPESSSEIQELRQLVSSMEQKLQDEFSSRDEQVKQQVLSEMKRNAEWLMKSNPDDYELVRAEGAIPQVMSLIERTYNETGEVLDEEEALQLVENHLVDKYTKISSYKKIQSKLAPAQLQPQLTQKPPMRTITSRDSSTTPMSAQERAIAAFYGQPIRR